MLNPYEIETPAIVSFSGGRSSGFMLWNIIEAFGGNLPSDLEVVFCNTGLEHEETYNFIKRISDNWCDITWLEYTRKDKNWVAKGEPEKNADFRIVDFDSSSRKGEVFSELVLKNATKTSKHFVPNPRFRICTAQMKIRTMGRYVKRHLKWDEWTNCVGLRYDEKRRYSAMKNDSNRESVVMPMYEAQHDEKTVKSFWKDHPLDLKLPLNSNAFGNCVGCFLKGRKKLEIIAQEEPWQLHWWANIEKATNDVFRQDRIDYATMLKHAHLQPSFDFTDESVSCFCTD